MRHYGLRAIDSDRREGPARGAQWARVGRVAVVAALLAGLGACTWTRGVFDPSNVNYRGAKTGPGLDVPPDLIGPKGDDRYVIPESGTGKTYSDYSRDRQDRANQAAQANSATEQASAIDSKTLLPSADGPTLRAAVPPEDRLEQIERAAAQWSMDNAQPAGRGSSGWRAGGQDDARRRTVEHHDRVH